MRTGQGRAFRDGIFSTAGADGAYGAQLRAYSDGVLGDAGRAYADGVLARTKPSSAYGTHLRSYSDGVLGVLDTLSDNQKIALGLGGLALAGVVVYVAKRR